MQLSGQIRSYCKKLTASRTDKSYRDAQTRVTCFTALLFHTPLSGQIRSYCKKLDCCRTNRIVMHRYVKVAPMRQCVITCCLDKSNRIGIETCYVLHCAAVSLSDILGTAVSIALYWSIAPKLSHQSFFRAQNQNSCSENIR